jgi:hypothetical protein
MQEWHSMSSSLNNLLSQAYGFIEADQLDDAVKLLKPILAENPNNPDAWWLYAHAVENVDDARASLQTVLNLDPNYPEARRLLDMLDEATKGMGSGNPLNDVSLQPIRAISDEEAGITSASEPMFADGDMGTRRDFEERVGAVRDRKAGGIPWRNIALAAALFLCAMIAALLFAPGFFNNAPATVVSTEVGADRTAEAAVMAMTNASLPVEGGTIEPSALTATAIVAADAGGDAQNAAPTAEGIVPAVTVGSPGIDLTSLSAALLPLGDGSGAEVESTSRGQTIVIRLCSLEPNVTLRDTLRQAVGLIAGQSVITAPEVEGVGFRLIDCADGSRVLRFLTAAASDVVEYEGGLIDATTFEARLTSN